MSLIFFIGLYLVLGFLLFRSIGRRVMGTGLDFSDFMFLIAFGLATFHLLKAIF
jgi:hypothetical protein